MKNPRIAVLCTGTTAILLVGLVALRTAREGCGKVVRDALSTKAHGEPAPAQLRIGSYKDTRSPHTQHARIITIGAKRFNFPQEAKSLKVSGAEFPHPLGSMPIAIILHSASGDMTHSFHETSGAAKNERDVLPPDTIEIVSGGDSWLVPNAAADEITVQCKGIVPGQKEFYVGAATDSVEIHLSVGDNEHYRTGATTFEDAIESGLISYGESKADAKHEFDAALERLRSLSDETLFLRAFDADEGDLIKSPIAGDAVDLALLLGCRWFNVPVLSVTLINDPRGHIYVMRRGKGTRYNYVVEGFDHDGIYRWNALIQIGIRPGPVPEAQTLDLIDDIVASSPAL